MIVSEPFEPIRSYAPSDLMVEGRCMKCKKQVEIKDGKESKMKNGCTMMKGKCGTCGTTVCCMMGKKK